MQPDTPQPPLVTRLLTQVSRIVGSRWTAGGDTVAVMLYLVVGAATGFGHGWQLAIQEKVHDRLHHADDRSET
jgi:low affinity Fe/Cu permease